MIKSVQVTVAPADFERSPLPYLKIVVQRMGEETLTYYQQVHPNDFEPVFDLMMRHAIEDVKRYALGQVK